LTRLSDGVIIAPLESPDPKGTVLDVHVLDFDADHVLSFLEGLPIDSV